MMDDTVERREGLTPWVWRLIVANLVALLLLKTVFVDPRFLAAVGFQPFLALARPWTFLTYLFVHTGLLHLAFNLLALYFFGPPVEARMGGRRFLAYYLACGAGAALLSYLLVLLVPVHLVVGASGAVLGVALAFAWYWPNQPVYVFPFPQPVTARWLVIFVVGLSMVLALFAANNGVAHLAHLGGIATGFLILKTQDLRAARDERVLRRDSAAALPRPPALVARSGRPARRSVAPPAVDRTQAEVDRVLDKISAKGISSLTPAERKFLAEMSRRMRDRA